MRKPPLTRAVDEAVRRLGSLQRLAEQLGVTRQAIEQWQLCPPKRVRQLEELSGVSRHELRPDVYGPREQKNAGKSTRGRASAGVRA